MLSMSTQWGRIVATSESAIHSTQQGFERAEGATGTKSKTEFSVGKEGS